MILSKESRKREILKKIEESIGINSSPGWSFESNTDFKKSRKRFIEKLEALSSSKTLNLMYKGWCSDIIKLDLGDVNAIIWSAESIIVKEYNGFVFNKIYPTDGLILIFEGPYSKKTQKFTYDKIENGTKK